MDTANPDFPMVAGDRSAHDDGACEPDAFGDAVGDGLNVREAVCIDSEHQLAANLVSKW